MVKGLWGQSYNLSIYAESEGVPRVALGRRATNGVFYSGQWQAQSAYTYDSTSRLTTASLPLANVSATYSRDIANSPPLSALTFREGGNTQLTVSRNYDLLNRLTGIASVPSASSVVSFAYTSTTSAIASSRYRAGMLRD